VTEFHELLAEDTLPIDLCLMISHAGDEKFVRVMTHQICPEVLQNSSSSKWDAICIHSLARRSENANITRHSVITKELALISSDV
jgi:hypothetical protein